eukprot:8085632-Pyramimonas_sp.AAC.1
MEDSDVVRRRGGRTTHVGRLFASLAETTQNSRSGTKTANIKAELSLMDPALEVRIETRLSFRSFLAARPLCRPAGRQILMA